MDRVGFLVPQSCRDNRSRRKAELANGPPLVDNLYDKVYVTGSRDNSGVGVIHTVITESWNNRVVGGGVRFLRSLR